MHAWKKEPTPTLASPSFKYIEFVKGVKAFKLTRIKLGKFCWWHLPSLDVTGNHYKYFVKMIICYEPVFKIYILHASIFELINELWYDFSIFFIIANNHSFRISGRPIGNYMYYIPKWFSFALKKFTMIHYNRCVWNIFHIGTHLVFMFFFFKENIITCIINCNSEFLSTL